MYAAQIVNNTVISVIVGNQEWAASRLGGYWVDTQLLVAIGDTYDANVNVFIKPQPYPSWSLDENYNWQPPVPMPQDDIIYVWDETNLVWQVIVDEETEEITDV